MRDLRTPTLTLALAVALLLLAPAVALAAEGPASASPAAEPVAEPAPAAPELTLTATPTTVTSGDRVRLVVGLGIPGATVQLTRLRPGEMEPVLIASLVTGSQGVVAYRVTPRLATTYRVDYAGDGQTWLPASAELTVQVRHRVSFSVADRIYRGRSSPLAVNVRPYHPGAAVTLQRWSNGAWTAWRTLTLGEDSRAHTTWRPDAEGLLRLRALLPDDAEHLEGASPVHRVQVVKPNPYNVPLEAKGIIVVDISQYTLRFYSHGRLLKTFPCVTGRPGLPTPLGHFKIYARGMWPGGPYGSRIMSYHPPCAIHGTNEPHLLSRFPRNFSHGCTRLYNSHAVWLYDHAPLGTPVWNVP